MAYPLTFYLADSVSLSGTSPEVLSGFLSGTSSDIVSGVLSGKLFGKIIPDISSCILTGISSDILSGKSPSVTAFFLGYHLTCLLPP